jgi:exonuclease SbcC
VKPLRITLRQFGPYAHHAVDLTPFHAEGLFLVHGDTGAGKSTLLDALAWSLYGKGLGSRTLDEHLRNKAAAADESTEVVLDFTLAGRPYRLRRAMAYARPARRGSSVTTQRAEASLSCLDPAAGFAPVTSPTAVNEAIEALLGLRWEQFSRIIVLPQGEFRTLLLASAADQERLLKHLFGTERFDAVEARLRAMTTEAEAALGATRAGLGTLLQSAGVESLDALEAARTEADGERVRLQGALAEARAALDAADTRAQSLAARHAREQRRAAWRAAWARHEAEAPTHRADEVRLRRAERAVECLACAARVAEAEPRALATRAQLAEASQRLESAATGLAAEALSSSRELRLAASRDELRLRLAALESLRAQEEEARQVARDAQGETDRLQQARGAREAASEEVARLRAQRDQRRRERDALDLALREEAQARGALDLLDRRRADRASLRAREDRRDEAARRRDDLQRRLAQAKQRREDATQTRDEARLRDRHALAARLAAGLVAGEPCPVCGGCEHPEPAVAADTVEHAEEALAQAERDLDVARAAEAEAQRQLDRCVDTYDRLRREVDEALRDDPASEEELDALLEAARGRVEAMQRARTQRVVAERTLDGLERQLTEASDRLAALERDIAGRTATLGQLALRAQAAQQALERAGVDPTALPEELMRVETEERATSRALADLLRERASLSTRRERARAEHDAAARALAEHERTLQDAQDALDRALAAQGFRDAAEASAASLPPAELQRLRDDVARVAREAQRLAAERSALGDDEAPVGDEELAAAQAARSLAQAAHDETQRRAGALEERARQLASVAAQLGEQRTAAEAASARHDLVHRVSRVVNGHNDGRIRLGRYVLLEQFDRVVSCASARLEGMSDGRFRLRRRELKAAGKEFELAVDDAYTGAVERAVATLSGGEMFMASLAMALGLGDVLQAWSGGVRIESLFVDEGFGSLDDESLDKAVAVLERLPDHARLVGVVSHVPELRKRIAARLEVVRTERGSVTRASVRGRTREPA